MTKLINGAYKISISLLVIGIIPIIFVTFFQPVFLRLSESNDSQAFGIFLGFEKIIGILFLLSLFFSAIKLIRTGHRILGKTLLVLTTVVMVGLIALNFLGINLF